MTPQELMQAILRARADLLWFGGIGTFIKAPGESDDMVGDRANDAVRISATEIRARVVGEGANLGMTQRGRVAFGLAGGRCNSDAIDNSAGVNTSDLEVNIKIAFGRALRDGRIDLKKRDTLLVAMTDEVAQLVLRNNYLQTLAVSLAERRGFEDFGFQLRLMQELEARGLLNRAVEMLPDDAAMSERQKAGKPLTRAEIGVLLAYAKIVLFDDLVATDVIDDAVLAVELRDYFPKRMRDSQADDIEAHRLRREIIATRVVNAMINDGGPTYLTRIADRTGADPAAIARAYIAVRGAFGLDNLRQAIDALDDKVSGTVQLGLYRAVQDLQFSETVWFLRNVSFDQGIGPITELFATAVDEVSKSIDAVVPKGIVEEIAGRAGSYRAAGVPDELALRVARLAALGEAPDIHLVADAAGCSLARAGSAFFATAERLHISRIEVLGRSLAVTDRYDGLALDRALATLGEAHRRITVAALGVGGGQAAPLEIWIGQHQAAVDRVVATNAAMTEGETATVSRVTVAANLLADLARH